MIQCQRSHVPLACRIKAARCWCPRSWTARWRICLEVGLFVALLLIPVSPMGPLLLSTC